MDHLRKILVDGREVEVPAHFTLLQACEEAGAEIPRFCFHQRLSIAGHWPHAPGRAEGSAQAHRVLRLGRARSPPRPERRAAGGLYAHEARQERRARG